MRTLIIISALLTATAVNAEPKRSAKEPVKPLDVKEAQAAFQPKTIETKPIEFAAPELELKTKDLSDAALDKKLAKRNAKTHSGEANVLREPVQLKVDETVAAPAATTANQP